MVALRQNLSKEFENFTFKAQVFSMQYVEENHIELDGNDGWQVESSHTFEGDSETADLHVLASPTNKPVLKKGSDMKRFKFDESELDPTKRSRLDERLDDIDRKLELIMSHLKNE